MRNSSAVISVIKNKRDLSVAQHEECTFADRREDLRTLPFVTHHYLLSSLSVALSLSPQMATSVANKNVRGMVSTNERERLEFLVLILIASCIPIWISISMVILIVSCILS